MQYRRYFWTCSFRSMDSRIFSYFIFDGFGFQEVFLDRKKHFVLRN
ncbi:hypothetical protein V6Z12_A12G065200 [Gossypium hirsutum]